MNWHVHPYNFQSPILKPFGPATPVPKTEAEIKAMCESLPIPGQTPEAVEAYVRKELADQERWPIFRNGNTARSYQVQLRWEEGCPTYPDPDYSTRHIPELVHVSIKRVDKAPVHDWRHFQEIKNMLVGPSFEAVELYPAEDRVVDTANQYHLWAFGNRNALKLLGFPVGLKTDTGGGGAVQRPRGQE